MALMQPRFWDQFSALQQPLVIGAIIAALIALGSALADRRRMRRGTLDAVGFMPWAGINLAAIMATVVLLALYISGRHIDF